MQEIGIPSVRFTIYILHTFSIMTYHHGMASRTKIRKSVHARRLQANSSLTRLMIERLNCEMCSQVNVKSSVLLEAAQTYLSILLSFLCVSFVFFALGIKPIKSNGAWHCGPLPCLTSTDGQHMWLDTS